jgi:PGF-pre-PGF domain-containing protein/PGF-CTERM protein
VKTDSGSVQSDFRELGVFEKNQSVELIADPGRAGSSLQFEGEDLQLVAVRIEGSSTAPDSTNELIEDLRNNGEDILTGQSSDTSARIVNETDTAGRGDVSFSFTPQESGPYALILVEKQNPGDPGLTSATSNLGQLTIESNISVVGADIVPVQTGDGSVTEPDAEVGADSVTFGVDASTNLGGEVSHTLVLYNQQTLADAEETIIVEDGSVTQVNSTIKTVDGVANVDSDAEVFGFSPSDQTFSGTTNIASFAQRFTDDVTVNPVSPNTTLQASIRSNQTDSPSTSLSVGLTDGFTAETEYRYVYIATEQDSLKSVTESGTITLDTTSTSPSPGPSPPSGDDDDDDRRSGGGGGGGGGGAGAAEDVEPPEEAAEEIDDIGAEPTRVETRTVSVDPGSGTATATFEESETVESAMLTTTDESVEVTVTDLDPDTVTDNPAPGQTVSLSDITVSESDGDSSDTEATVRFRLSNERLQEREATAENLRVFRLTGGSWQGLATSVAEETETGVVLEAQTPGFSVFAVSAVTPPEAALSLSPTTAQVGEDITLSGVDSTDEDGEIVSYEYSVNGQTFSGETVTVSLDDPGDYTVELTVTDDSGETDTVTEALTVTQAGTATMTQTTTQAPAPDTPTPTPGTDTPATPTTSDPLIPGFGFTTAILALLAATLVAIRRRSSDE